MAQTPDDPRIDPRIEVVVVPEAGYGGSTYPTSSLEFTVIKGPDPEIPNPNQAFVALPPEE